MPGKDISGLGMPFTRRGMLAGGVAVLGAGLTACERDSRILRSADAHPSGYPTVEAVREMGRMLEARSGGELVLKTYPGAQLGQEEDTLELTIFGGIDVNRINLSPLNPIAPETVVPALPFLFRNEAHMRAALDGAPGRQILDSLYDHGLVGLCFYDSGARSFYTRDRLIHSPADMRGLKIRVMNSNLFVSMVEALGGNATPMAYGEVYQGLMQGVIDGAENNWPSFESSRHFEAAPFYSLTQHVMAPEVLVVSRRRWEQMSVDQQALMRECARDSVPYMRALWDQRSTDAEARLREAGVEIITPDPEPFAARVEGVWQRYLNTPRLQRLAEDILAMGDATS
jgi:tripartite ATP-independent transporter DctP family solute receptor